MKIPYFTDEEIPNRPHTAAQIEAGEEPVKMTRLEYLSFMLRQERAPLPPKSLRGRRYSMRERRDNMNEQINQRALELMKEDKVDRLSAELAQKKEDS
jgi:hypothetical protein